MGDDPDPGVNPEHDLAESSPTITEAAAGMALIDHACILADGNAPVPNVTLTTNLGSYVVSGLSVPKAGTSLGFVGFATTARVSISPVLRLQRLLQTPRMPRS